MPHNVSYVLHFPLWMVIDNLLNISIAKYCVFIGVASTGGCFRVKSTMVIQCPPAPLNSSELFLY